MWLVLCDASDAAGLWAYRELRARGVAPLEIVTADDLVLADRWEHRVGDAGASIRIQVNGLDIVGTRLTGVLNRLYTAPTAHWRSATPADQEYVQQELTALFLSWLHALPCPVINRPTPQGLGGQWRNESEWAFLAHRAGLPVLPYRQSPNDGIDEFKGQKRLVPTGALVKTVIVLGRAVAGAALPPPIAAACRRLTEMSCTELLGVDFIEGPSNAWTFVGATPMPYLTLGGAALIDALCERLAVTRLAS